MLRWFFFYHFRCVFRDDGYKFLNVKFENMKVLVEYPKEDFRRMDKKTGVVRNEDKKKLRFRIPDEMYVAMKLRMEPEILRYVHTYLICHQSQIDFIVNFQLT